jgi:hypothetical protein
MVVTSMPDSERAAASWSRIQKELLNPAQTNFHLLLATPAQPIEATRVDLQLSVLGVLWL